MSKPLSWKWKLTIAFVVLAFLGMAFIFSQGGYEWMRGRLDRAYDETPEKERRDSEVANEFLNLAGWRATLMDPETAMRMYKEFCGIKEPLTVEAVLKTGKLDGKCSPDGKTGWGPMHPRAPEAYYKYMLIFDSDTSASSQYIRQVGFDYYRLFYTYMKYFSPDHKPHPKFNCYWDKIQKIMSRGRVEIPNDINMSAPGAAKCPDAD